MRSTKIFQSGRGLLLLAVFLTSILMVGCGPTYATDEQMKEYAATVTHGEKAEFVEKIGERRLHYKTERGVEFDVWTFDKDIQIDGSHVCYTDEYGIADDYDDGVYNLYKEEIERLMEGCGLNVKLYSPQFDCLSAFTLVVDESVLQEQAGKIDTFLTGLRDIAKREAALHSDGYSVKFPCEVKLHAEDGYYNTKSAEGWTLTITASTPDAYLDIRKWVRSDTRSENVVSPDRNGVLVEVTGSGTN